MQVKKIIEFITREDYTLPSSHSIQRFLKFLIWPLSVVGSFGYVFVFHTPSSSFVGIIIFVLFFLFLVFTSVHPGEKVCKAEFILVHLFNFIFNLIIVSSLVLLGMIALKWIHDYKISPTVTLSIVAVITLLYFLYLKSRK